MKKVSIFLVFLVAACGGGGGSSSTSEVNNNSLEIFISGLNRLIDRVAYYSTILPFSNV